MSLRTRLLSVFAALAVVPLLALSIFEYVRSMDAVRKLIADQTSTLAERAARQIGERFQIINGDLRLIAENDETIQLYEARRRGGPPPDSVRDRARAYLDNAWRVLGGSYAWISLRDSAGAEVERLSGAGGERDAFATNQSGPIALVDAQVRNRDTGATLGAVVAAIQLRNIAPRAVMEPTFGHSGYVVMADTTGRTIYDPLSPSLPRGTSAISAWHRTARVPADSGAAVSTIRLSERDTEWVATAALIPHSPLVVLASSAVGEFTSSFAGVRGTNLLIALLLTTTLAIVFVIVTRRTTRPLETLTAAAEEIGRGNFRPALPAAGRDEVGRLTSAFATMSGHVDRMVAELEASRQMAAVGSFAGQIAHEIRNPLTSIKLNLQSLERDAREGLVAADSRRTVEICLEEIQRLDRVVRGVLTLGRAAPPAVQRRITRLAAILDRAIDVMRPQLEQQGIIIDYQRPSTELSVDAHEEQLVGMFLNLFVNAAEAMPCGGRVRVSAEAGFDTAGGAVARIIVVDSGPGVRDAERARIFEPFFTTKPQGAGIGLAAALRDVEQHRGRLTLIDNDTEETGAQFAVELPLVSPDSE